MEMSCGTDERSSSLRHEEVVLLQNSPKLLKQRKSKGRGLPISGWTLPTLTRS